MMHCYLDFRLHRLVLCGVLALLTGCAGYPPTPYSLETAGVPHSETSIFVSIDQSTSINSMATVSRVDGQRIRL
jgi:hypothetical protein